MLDADIKDVRKILGLKLENANDLELQWEAKAYSDCIRMIDEILKKNGLL